MAFNDVLSLLTDTSLKAVLVGLICFQMFPYNAADDNTVFFNNYGDCVRSEPLEVEHGKITLKSFGGQVAYETSVCSMTFHTSSRACLHFREFHISNCDVILKIYSSKSASGRPMRTLGCGDPNPGQICSTNNYFSLLLFKRKLTKNTGYEFVIDLIPSGGNSVFKDSQSLEDDESNENRYGDPSIARSKEKGKGGTPLFPIVLGVLVVIVVIAVVGAVALYHCRRQRGVYSGQACTDTEARRSRLSEDVEESAPVPSAPPIEEPPPPYVDPPPYDEEFHGGRTPGDVYENTPMMANR